MLGQDADEALDGAEDHAVDHDGTMLLAVSAGVGQVETLGQVHIQLDGTALPGTAQAVGEVEVDLGAVESAVAFVDHVIHAQIIQSALQAVGSQLPHLIGADGILGAGGKLHMILEAKAAVHFVDQVVHALDLVADLLGGHEDVGVILSEAAHAHEAVQGAALLVTVHQTQLAGADGQVAVAPQLAHVDQHAAGAVHGLDGEVGLIDLGGVHVLFVVIPVTGALPQAAVEHDGGLDFFVASLAVDLTPVVLQQVAQNHSLGVEEGEAGALVLHVEQIQLAAQLAVVALLGFLDAVQMLLQLFLGGEGGGIDTAQHLVVLIATPVSASHVGQLEGLDVAQVGQVGAHAQVGKVTHLIEGDLFAFGQILNQFHLVGLFLLPEVSDGSFPLHQVAAGTDALLGAVHHFLLDLGQVFGGEGHFHIEVVVEAVGDGGADGHLGVGVELLDGHGHQVAGGVEEHLAAFGVVKGDGGDGLAGGHRSEEILHGAVFQLHSQILFQIIGEVGLDQIANTSFTARYFFRSSGKLALIRSPTPASQPDTFSDHRGSWP